MLLLFPNIPFPVLPAGAGTGVAFWLMAAVCVLGALRVVTAKNPVHAALALILTLAAVSGIYVLLEAPFVWAVQLLVYTGGVMVLYLFVIFFSDLRQMNRQRWLHKGWLWSLPPLAALMFLLVNRFLAMDFAGASGQTTSGTPNEIGNLLFGKLVIPFELSSILLVVALIGAILLSRESPDEPRTGA